MSIVFVYTNVPFFTLGWNATLRGWQWRRVEHAVNCQVPRGSQRWYAYWEAAAGNAGAHAVMDRQRRRWLV